MEFRNSSDVVYAEQLIQEGKRREAFNVLSEFVKRDPSSVQAWYLLSTLVGGDEKQLYCLDRALKLDPNHRQARERFAGIKGLPGGRPKAKPTKKRSSLGIVFLLLVCAIAGVAGMGYVAVSQPELVNSILFTPTFTASSTSTTTFTPPPTVTLTPSLTPRPTASPFPTETPVTPLSLIYSTWTPAPISQDDIGPAVGLYAPDFDLKSVTSSNRIRLSNYAGKPVVLVFWSNDSAKGIKYLAAIEKLFENYNSKGLVILTVAVKMEAEAVLLIRDDEGLIFTMAVDPNGKNHALYGNLELPLSVFIGKSQKIKELRVGLLSYEELESNVQSLLREQVTATP